MSQRFSTFIKNGGQVSVKTGNARLLKLAEHLERGDLYHKKFDFSAITRGTRTKACGTAGCAMGELPFLFPRDWKWTAWESVNLRGFDTVIGAAGDTARYFGIAFWEAENLFYPTVRNGLRDNATATEVAANIRQFVAQRKRLAAQQG